MICARMLFCFEEACQEVLKTLIEFLNWYLVEFLTDEMGPPRSKSQSDAVESLKSKLS